MDALETEEGRGMQVLEGGRFRTGNWDGGAWAWAWGGLANTLPSGTAAEVVLGSVVRICRADPGPSATATAAFVKRVRCDFGAGNGGMETVSASASMSITSFSDDDT